MPSALIIALAICLAAGACYVLLVVVDLKGRRRVVDTGDSGGGSWPWESGAASGWFKNTATDVMGNPIDGGGSDGGGSDGGGDGGGGD
jgi:hypothetical protein